MAKKYEAVFINDERWPENYTLTGDEELAIRDWIDENLEKYENINPQFALIIKKFWKKYHMLSHYHTVSRYQWSIGEDPNDPEEPFQLDPGDD
jgi:hypothetical protein